MTLRSRVMGAISTFGAPPTAYGLLPAGRDPNEDAPEAPRDRYYRLRAFYRNTRLYDDLAAHLYHEGIWKEALKELRNPTHAAVEFYASTLWSGMMDQTFELEFPETMRASGDDPVTPGESSHAQRLETTIQQVWTWSNWAQRRSVFARGLPMLGDQFLRIATREDQSGKVVRVFIQIVKPEYVTEFEKDERGYITYIRVDVPQIRRTAEDKPEAFTRTEVWDKATGRMRVWEHTRGDDEDIDRLGDPIVNEDMARFGVDFVPFVHCMFRDIDDERGEALIEPCMTKVIEADRSVTRLHQMLFRHNDATWVLRANGNDPSGRPIPAPRISGNDDGTVKVGDSSFYRLPGTSELQPLVPPINYADALLILQDHMRHLRDVDLPELRYYAMAESQELSGIAIRYLMAPAVDRVLEVRSNAETSLIQADMMALSIGAFHKLPGFTDLGDYDSGDYEHSFKPRDVIPTSELEEQEINYRRSQANVLKAQYGYSRQQLWREDGLDDDEIKTMESESEAEQRTVADEVLTRFERGQKEPE